MISRFFLSSGDLWFHEKNKVLFNPRTKRTFLLDYRVSVARDRYASESI